MPYKDPEKQRAWIRAYQDKQRDAINARARARRQANPAQAHERDARYRSKDYSDTYYRANADRINAGHRARYAANPQAKLAKNKAHREAHPEETALRTRRWQRNNRDKMRAAAKAYRERHPDRAQASAYAYRSLNRALCNAMSVRYHQANPEKHADVEKRRRAKKRGSERNDFTHQQWLSMLVLCDYHCCYCEHQFPPEALTQDHLTPITRGGNHTLWNILPACVSCNARKNHRGVLCPVQPFLLL